MDTERRARQAARIRIWAPWAKSTGPKTEAGKRKSAANAFKHGDRAGHMRLMRKAFTAQSRFLRNVNALITMKKRYKSDAVLNQTRHPERASRAEGSLPLNLKERFLAFARNDDREISPSTNELLDSLTRKVGIQGLIAANMLQHALFSAELSYLCYEKGADSAYP